MSTELRPQQGQPHVDTPITGHFTGKSAVSRKVIQIVVLSRKLEMLTCGSKIWEELHRLAASDIVVEVEHVKAHRTKKDKK